MSFVAQPSIQSGIYQPNAILEFDPIREIASRISKLSYGDMKRLAEELHGLNIKHSGFSFADGLYDWAQEKAVNPLITGR